MLRALKKNSLQIEKTEKEQQKGVELKNKEREDNQQHCPNTDSKLRLGLGHIQTYLKHLIFRTPNT